MQKLIHVNTLYTIFMSYSRNSVWLQFVFIGYQDIIVNFTKSN
ncbi:hypothetical protein C943_02445 [Mariniradius saccharolyticus AK6]|uniref:Uncharacterized protein n=1 Tax=Mariniradius saccharolyticus AK6 TaxID=1239962 RepID=M7X9F2_9BACT|nr:hypothetical protein C943_02445 [Mariniradius saccharolyticus AK6]